MTDVLLIILWLSGLAGAAHAYICHKKQARGRQSENFRLLAPEPIPQLFGHVDEHHGEGP